MEFVQLPLVQDFNKLYSDILNCDIVPPPFYLGRVPQSFFLKKRGAFVAVEGAEVFDEIFDIYEIGNDVYYIGKIGTDLLVKKNATTIHTGTYTTGVQYKFFITQWPKGAVYDSGTGANGSVVGPDLIITDSTKTFTVNALSLKYVYLYEADVGQWQVLLIDSNTSTTMTVTSTGWKSEPKNAKYKIFDSYGFVLSFVAEDYIYNIQDDASVTPVKTIASPMDAVYFNDNYYIVDQSSDLHIGGYGIFAAYFSGKSNLGSYPDTFNIINFKDYILLVGNKWISAVRSMNRIDNTWATVTDRVVIPVSHEVAMLSQWAYTIYNQGLYILSQNKKFIGVNIADVGIDKFTVSTTNHGIYIQQFLDNITTSDTLRIGISDQNIYITASSAGSTTIFNYDMLYMGWHRWVTLLPISNFKLNRFIGDTLYIKWFDAAKDNGTELYDQNIRAVIGEDNILSMKRAILTKMVIWKNTTKDAYIHYNVLAGGNIDKYIKQFKESAYLQDIRWYSLQTNGTLGNQLLGISLLAQSSTDALDLLADFANIENPTWFFYEICIIDIKATGTDEFEFGWMLLGYNKFEPQVTSYKNVI